MAPRSLEINRQGTSGISLLLSNYSINTQIHAKENFCPSKQEWPEQTDQVKTHTHTHTHWEGTAYRAHLRT